MISQLVQNVILDLHNSILDKIRKGEVTMGEKKNQPIAIHNHVMQITKPLEYCVWVEKSPNIRPLLFKCGKKPYDEINSEVIGYIELDMYMFFIEEILEKYQLDLADFEALVYEGNFRQQLIAV